MDPARDLTNVTLDGRYLLTRLIGEGGMGQVYEGIHGLLDRKIAVKVLLPRYAYDVRFRERFLREAKAASKVRHPNIVQILDFGETPNGSVYFAMEFLEGHDLLTLLGRVGPLPWARARHMLLQITSALGAAHERKVIHRDIKPANVFITNARGHQEFIKVLDFGIAKIGSEATDENTAAQDLTGTNEVFGTAKYMAPEQAYGVSDDPRVDIYSVGVAAYQMLTGVVPFTGVSAFHIITRHVNEAPLPPRELNPAIPPAVEEVILRALAKNPAHRFASMDQMGQMLSMIPADLVAPSGASPAPAPHPSPPVTASHTEIATPRPGDSLANPLDNHTGDPPPFTAPQSIPPSSMDLAVPPWETSGRRATVPAGFGPSAFEPGHRIPSSPEPPGRAPASRDPVGLPDSPPQEDASFPDPPSDPEVGELTADVTAISTPLESEESATDGAPESERRAETRRVVDPEASDSGAPSVVSVRRSEELAAEGSTSRMRGRPFDDGATSPGESESRVSATDSLAAIEAAPPTQTPAVDSSSPRRGLAVGLLVLATAGGVAVASLARSSSDEPPGRTTPALAPAPARIIESPPPPAEPTQPTQPTQPTEASEITPATEDADLTSPASPELSGPGEPSASPPTQTRQPPARTNPPPPLTDKRAKSRLSRTLKRKCRDTQGAGVVTVQLLVGSTGRVLSKTFQGASPEQRTCLSGGLGDAEFPEGTTRKVTFSVAL